jgi:predicted MFS family arabinose efflux permease
MQEKYPDYRWYVLITLIVAHLLQGMALIGPTPLVGSIAETLHANLGSATAVSMLPFTLMVAIGGLISGMVIDRWSRESRGHLFHWVLSSVSTSGLSSLM